MVLETDAPYLSSEPFDIPSLAEKIAELMLVDLLREFPNQRFSTSRSQIGLIYNIYISYSFNYLGGVALFCIAFARDLGGYA